MKKWVTLLLCAGVFLASAACGNAQAEPSVPEPGVYERDGALIVALEGNPTTGYEWMFESDLAAGCLSCGESEYTPYPATELLSTGGVFSFRFEPVAAGEQTLRFAYLRSWEENSTIETYEITVTVRERATGFRLDWE